MSKKRDMDRLASYLLKVNATIVIDAKKALEKLDKEKLTSRNRLNGYKAVSETIVVFTQLTAEIMSKAENSKAFSFNKRDENDLSLDDICEAMNIKIPKELMICEEEEKSEPSVTKMKMTTEQAKDLLSMLEKLEKASR